MYTLGYSIPSPVHIAIDNPAGYDGLWRWRLLILLVHYPSGTAQCRFLVYEPHIFKPASGKQFFSICYLDEQRQRHPHD